MASIPGAQFSVTGASGSQGLLSPQNAWRVYVLPRGGAASQDSTGALITFDSAAVASRFAANDFIQSGLLVTNIRQVSAVGGNSISVSGANLTVSQNDRIFLIGTTEPVVSGPVATYVPNTIVRQRDDDAAAIYTNSQVTSDSNGLIQFFSDVATYDVLIQDGDRLNQGSIIDLPVGAVEGVSTEFVSVFGATVTFNAAIGITGSAVFGDTISIIGTSGNYEHVGTVLFGQTVTINGAVGVTGTAVFGSTITVVGSSGNYEHTGTVVFGNTVTMAGALGITGPITGTTATFSGDMDARRIFAGQGTGLTSSDFSLGAGFGNAATVTFQAATVTPNDMRGTFDINSLGTGQAANPICTITLADGTFAARPPVIVSRTPGGDQRDVVLNAGVAGILAETIQITFRGTPVVNETYGIAYVVIG